MAAGLMKSQRKSNTYPKKICPICGLSFQTYQKVFTAKCLLILMLHNTRSLCFNIIFMTSMVGPLTKTLKSSKELLKIHLELQLQFYFTANLLISP
eukprot:TRINITY_DN3314_c4_g1_i4.p1 TRINITY_DN3314_c4_g1~~TRINITY_DN3314_c4_g1_i4.p1  ORF type:complete len:96 (-),score=7.98 TRINITY_DN3314_c4_g1_i4:1812-2099(-)